ncbi:hypothetical protein [Catellatospora vulcania]|uniref:hypothetical protein n=1 Tax=Catellatospora vulcania TaxID=1460450 RepID=UPI0012D4147B|nr:hypothetical protein [Catellatospora vulcania]
MAATVRPDQGAALLAAGVPLALAWLIDHGIALAEAGFVLRGELLPGTGLGVRILIWLPLWALALAAGVLVESGRRRGLHVAPAAALREAARRAVAVLCWLVPFAITAAALYAVLDWLSYGTFFFVVVLAVLASPALVLPAWLLFRRFPALPLLLFENAGRRAATHAVELRKNRRDSAADLVWPLAAPLPVALLLSMAWTLLAAVLAGLVGKLPEAVPPAAVAPLFAGATSAVQALFAGVMSAALLLVVSVLVARQAGATAEHYLRPRADGDPGRVADLAQVDATLSRLAAPRPKPVHRAWLAAYALPVVLLAAAALGNPGGLPELVTVDAAPWPKVLGLDPRGLPVIVAQSTVTRCRDVRCEVRTTTEITGRRIDAASVTPDGGVVALHLPGKGYGESPSPSPLPLPTLMLTECDAADRCAERLLRLDAPQVDLGAVSVAVLPTGGVLLLAAVYERREPSGGSRGMAAWRCTATCVEVALDSPDKKILSRPSSFVTGHDWGGGPVIMWSDDIYDDTTDAYRAFCETRECDRVFVRPVPPLWQDLPGEYDLVYVGLDDRGSPLAAVSRPGSLSCKEWCLAIPSLDPKTLSIVRCRFADCSARTAEAPLLPLGRTGAPPLLIATGPRGAVVVQVTGDGQVTICVANCGP